MTDIQVQATPPPAQPLPPQAPGASGKAISALILGIASLVMCGFITGIPAFFIGRSEEKAIDRGESPAAGKTLAKVGWILGLISLILTCISFIVFGAYMMLLAPHMKDVINNLPK